MQRQSGAGSRKEITIVDRKGREVLKEALDLNTHIIDLKKLIQEKTKLKVERQYLTLGRPSEDPKAKKTTMNDGYKTLSEYSLEQEGNTITVKDLGLQVGWRTVFIVEYAGPMIVFGINYLIASARGKLASIQKLAFILILIHYLKRELESVFLHVFSRDTMPFKRIFINSFHYWFTCGTLISVELYYFWKDPGYSQNVQYILFGLLCFFEFMNLMCHITLKNLRAKLDNEAKNTPYDQLKLKSKRGIPEGWGFGLVTCANYWWETCVWVAFAALVRCWTAYVFLGFSFYQMTEWALQKHRHLKKEFDGKEGKPLYPRHRKAIVPFVI